MVNLSDKCCACSDCSPTSLSPLRPPYSLKYNNTVSPLHNEPSSCELSTMQICIRTSNHVSQFTCLADIVTCLHPLQVVVLLCTLLYNTVQSTVVQYLYFKTRMSGSKLKSSGDIAGATVLFKVLYYKIKNVFFIFCVYFLCIICVKRIINLLQYSIYSQLC